MGQKYEIRDFYAALKEAENVWTGFEDEARTKALFHFKSLLGPIVRKITGHRLYIFTRALRETAWASSDIDSFYTNVLTLARIVAEADLDCIRCGEFISYSTYSNGGLMELGIHCCSQEGQMMLEDYLFGRISPHYSNSRNSILLATIFADKDGLLDMTLDMLSSIYPINLHGITLR